MLPQTEEIETEHQQQLLIYAYTFFELDSAYILYFQQVDMLQIQ